MTTTTTMTAWLGVVQSTHGEPLVDHFGFRFVDNCTTRRMLNLFLLSLPPCLSLSLYLSRCFALVLFLLFLAHCAWLWVPSLFALMKGLQAKLINGHTHTHSHTPRQGTHSARCLLLTWPRPGMPGPLNSSCCTRFAMDHNCDCDCSWSWARVGAATGTGTGSEPGSGHTWQRAKL